MASPNISTIAGGMSKQPHQVTTSSLVFNGIKVVGVAMGATLMQPKNAAIRTKIFDELQVKFGALHKIKPLLLATLHRGQTSRSSA
jgi:hypothetical protein